MREALDARPTRARNSRARASISASRSRNERRLRTVAQKCSGWCAWTPTFTLSSTVRSSKRRMFWNVRVMPSRATTIRGLMGDVLPVELDGAGRRRDHPREQVEQRGLARAVGPDDPVDGAGRQAQVVVGERDQAAEALGQAADREDGRCLRGRCGGQAQQRWILRGGRFDVDARPRPWARPSDGTGIWHTLGTSVKPRRPAARRDCRSRVPWQVSCRAEVVLADGGRYRVPRRRRSSPARFE